MQVADKTAQGVPSNATPKAMAAVLSTAVTAVKPAGTTDLARQAIHTTQGAARAASVQAMVAKGLVIVGYYVSEQMDTGTCGACMRLNGTHYSSLEEAWADYRPEGGCLWCEGGLRCRGVLVITWADETPATVQEPYDGVTPDTGVPGGPGQPPSTGPTSDMPEPIRAIQLDVYEPVEHAVPYRRIRTSVRDYDDLERFAVGDDWRGKKEASEIEIRDWLARRHIAVAKVTPNTVAVPKATWPDALLVDHRATVEFKELKVADDATLKRRLIKASRQSRHVIVDARGLGISQDEARRLLTGALDGLSLDNPGRYLDQIVVILEGKGVPPLEWFRG